MRTTIDAAGRIVVPKALRDALGLTGGQDVDVTTRGGSLEVRPTPTRMSLDSRGGGHLVAV